MRLVELFNTLPTEKRGKKHQITSLYWLTWKSGYLRHIENWS